MTSLEDEADNYTPSKLLQIFQSRKYRVRTPYLTTAKKFMEIASPLFFEEDADI